MPVAVGIWRPRKTGERVEFSVMPADSRLDASLTDDTSIIDSNSLLSKKIRFLDESSRFS
jgi:hypothetical protein